MKAVLLRVKQWLHQHWKRVVLYGGGGLLLLVILAQLLYPQDRLTLNATIDGVSMSGWKKADTTWELNHRYLAKSIDIYFGKNDTAYRTPTTGEVGMFVENNERIDSMVYPWWLRIVPSSLLWAHHFSDPSAPAYTVHQKTLDTYVKKELGASCNVAPIDATITFEEDRLKAVPSAPGGTCEINDVKSKISQVQPVLTAEATARVPIKEIKPAVLTAEAEALVSELTDRISDGLTMKVGDESVIVESKQVMSWLDFTVTDDTLTPSMSNERAADYLTKTIAPKVAARPGVTTITTRDFMEIKREDGRSGRALHIDKTLANVLSYITAKSDDVIAATQPVAPRVEYIRTYSPTHAGLNALLTNYAKDHEGTFGISLIELSGERRRASHNADKSFTTASTYKLFVAYSTLKRVDAGEWHWNDVNIAGGRNLAGCFDDMIVKSDNACAKALLEKVGYREITNEVHAIGLTNTSFITGVTPSSTAGDEALFLAQLESKQLPISDASRDRLLDAMKRNIFRQGIPSGTNGTVADKVGFLWGLLHDAAIVYSPSGTYVLVIMTDGSSWSAIAELTRQIEALRSS